MSNSPDTPWYKLLNREHWFVFTMASLAWMFDCLDQQLFNLARPDAMKALLEPGQDPKLFGGYATAIFVAGWAMGGLIFGAVGDRIGRAKTLTFTVLIYSLCTGLSAFSTGFTDFAIYRFITGLGVGGVFGLAVALVADSLPDKARPSALGLLQALSAVGNVTASLIAICVGYLELGRITPGSAWSKLFLIGALPAFLCVFIQVRLKEPEKWVKAKAASKASGTQFGSYSALLGNPRWRSRAIAGLFMCVAGVVGVWGIGFFSVELINDVIGRSLRQEGVAKELIPGTTTIWKGINLMMQNVGAFLGMMTFTRLAARFGRKPVLSVAFLAALISTWFTFRFLNQRSDIFWMIPIMGFCQMSVFAGYAIYLPELFPVSLRSTGTSFCYNVGRFLAAAGPYSLGQLSVWLTPAVAAAALDTEKAAAKLQGFRDACCWMSLVFLVGIIAVRFLPETKGLPLPEDQDAAKAL